MCVAYFDLGLGAAHSKCWSKYTFSKFFVEKEKKSKICRKCHALVLIMWVNKSIILSFQISCELLKLKYTLEH